MADFRAVWLDVDESHMTLSQTVECRDGEALAGSLTLAVRNAEDEDDPTVGLTWASTEQAYRGGAAGVFLIQEVARRFQGALITAGPLEDDEDPGPRYRLRCWVDAQVPVHEPGCAVARGDRDCECLEWIRREVLHRLAKRRDLGGSSDDVIASQEYKESVVALGL